ncbi:hypothetical protein M422DRAFT_60558 [Sphaerobolus stellatus SS14]|uniref:Major facilitator superfamily (MFS) profile domain-containing protein n=1 Tax=Sphaerobolus stellatus (strain SS14) TaxID=990650 RepID=A0A0C9UBK2_SPHS4|nr:hypothetical protein M422DRAFT_60558 [Sphaerobolus stellatus SS14]
MASTTGTRTRRLSPPIASEDSEPSRNVTPLPLSQLLIVLYMQISEPVTAHVILPFIVQLVEDTGVTGGDITRVGYYTGFVESLFFIMEALTTLQWGRISDRIGRRNVMLIGLLGSCIASFLFGLSHSFTAIVISRGLAGLLNGNNGVGKCMLGEITDDSNRAKGYGALSLTWALGNSIGPLLGGLLQHPYERFGGIFYHDFFERNPYFLPCAVAGLVPLSAFIVAGLFLNETLPSKHQSASKTDIPRLTEGTMADSSVYSTMDEASPSEETPLLANERPVYTLRSTMTPRVVIAVANYAVLALVDICFYVLMTLFLTTPISKGGLGFPSALAGTCIAAFGIADGIASVVLFPSFIRYLGPKKMATAVYMAYIGVYCMFIVTHTVVRYEDKITPLVWVCFVTQVILATATPMGYGTIGLYITAAAPSRFALGATNGLAQTTGAIVRCVAPPCASTLFALSIRFNIFSGNFSYLVMAIVAIGAGMVTRLLPETPWETDWENEVVHE